MLDTYAMMSHKAHWVSIGVHVQGRSWLPAEGITRRDCTGCAICPESRVPSQQVQGQPRAVNPAAYQQVWYEPRRVRAWFRVLLAWLVRPFCCWVLPRTVLCRSLHCEPWTSCSKPSSTRPKPSKANHEWLIRHSLLSLHSSIKCRVTSFLSHCLMYSNIHPLSYGTLTAYLL